MKALSDRQRSESLEDDHIEVREEDPVLKSKRGKKRSVRDENESPETKNMRGSNDFGYGSFKPWEDTDIPPSKRSKAYRASQSMGAKLGM